MVKHNNVVPNQHFRKDWQRYVVTWFNQPARKRRRKNTRIAKAKKIAPRPLGLLRPQVQGCTLKHNSRTRLGRGFSLEELKGAKVSKKIALTIGIAVDWRRTNRSQETYKANVARLKLYKKKLVLFPRNSKKVKKGEATKEECALGQQITGCKSVFPIRVIKPRIKARKITKKERRTQVTNVLRANLLFAKRWGRVEKSKVDALEAAKNKAKKKDKKKKKGKK